MSLQAKLEEDLRTAMREGNTLSRSVIRYLRSEIHNEEIDKQTVLDDEGIITVLSRQVQRHRDSIEAFTNGNRHDLVEKEKAELSIVLQYLPEQMSQEEIVAVVERTIQEVSARGPQDMGRVMARVMSQVRGKAEGRQVSAAASEILNRLAE